MKIEKSGHEPVQVLHDIHMSQRRLLRERIRKRPEQRMCVRRRRLIVSSFDHGRADKIELCREPHHKHLEKVGLDAEALEEGERAPVLEALGLRVPCGRAVGEGGEEKREGRLDDVVRGGGGDCSEELEHGVTTGAL